MSFNEAHDPFDNQSEINLPKSNITKWPFILSDVLLVIISIVLAFSNGAPLSAQAFGCCILGVALGSCIAVMPFILDHVLNSKTHTIEHHLQNKESLWLALEEDLINNQKSNFKRIKELEAKLEAFESQKATPIPAVEKTAPKIEDGVDLKSLGSIPLRKVLGPASALQQATAQAAPSTELAEPDTQPSEAMPSTKKTPLLAKAIAQSQKNNPSKTVQRIIGSLAQKPAES